jgi:predicted nucleic acid-binding protein
LTVRLTHPVLAPSALSWADEQGQTSTHAPLERTQRSGHGLQRASSSADETVETGGVRPGESDSTPARFVTPTAFVVDSNVALLGFIDEAVLVPHRLEAARCAARFFEQAQLEKAVLHVPTLFDSEIRNAIYRDGIAKGLFSFEDGLALGDAILGANWQRHTPNLERVYHLQRAMERTNSTGDAEFLAVAEALGCPLVTDDGPLISTVTQRGIGVTVLEITAYPWVNRVSARR